MPENFENNFNRLPYNPSDVDIRQQIIAVNDIIIKISKNEIELWSKEDYQRLSNVWDDGKKSRLIESLIMRIPIPVIYLDGSKIPWKIIDGLQRLTALYDFIHGKEFKLTGLEYLIEIEGKYFDQLPFQYQRVIRSANLGAYIINPGTPETVKLDIFLRINTGGVPLTAQEIRNVYYQGKPADFINKLADEEEFVNILNTNTLRKRMKDREWVLRFFAFYKVLDLYQPPMDNFLNKAMAAIEQLTYNELGDINYRFLESLKVCRKIFGNHSFTIPNPAKQGRISKPYIRLFEAWTVNIARLDNSEREKLVQRKDMIKREFDLRLQKAEFYNSLKEEVTSKERVEVRFNEIRDLITEVLNAD